MRNYMHESNENTRTLWNYEQWTIEFYFLSESHFNLHNIQKIYFNKFKFLQGG